jgi:hypothetical protein
MSAREDETRHCLDLFSGLEGFSTAFAATPNWTVTTVDIDPSFEPDICADVFELRPGDLPAADVVLASPPCTLFSTAGNHDEWDGTTKTPTGARAKRHVALVYHTLGLIHALSPTYWILENPLGRLRWILGSPTGTVTYCQYGTNYQKPTDLWGRHPPGLTYQSCARGDPCHRRNGHDDGYSAIASMPSETGERAKVPDGLSEAILHAVENRGQQATLTEVTSP